MLGLIGIMNKEQGTRNFEVERIMKKEQGMLMLNEEGTRNKEC
jgi:hypothetical protein